MVKKHESGFLSKPAVILALEKAVNNPDEKKRCSVMTKSYLVFRILQSSAIRLRFLFSFLFQTKVLFRNG